MTAGPRSLVRTTSVRLSPDPSRTVATLFVPGEELPDDHSRATAVVARVMALDDAQVAATLADLSERFATRHRWLNETFDRNFGIAYGLVAGDVPSPDRCRLIGAYFTHEYAPAAASLTNPSIVAHPDQSALNPGELRFVMSARAVGEGHCSGVEFRTGVVTDVGAITLMDPGPLLDTGEHRSPVYERSIFSNQIADLGHDVEVANAVLDRLGPRFDKQMLDQAVAGLDPHILRRRAAKETLASLARVAANNYEVVFGEYTAIGERVLLPASPAESHGIEDARFVRFEDGGGPIYHATYTAYDGNHVVPQLLTTTDFRHFASHQLSGPSARNKGMALFPRRIDGRFVALSRWDRENNSIATSEDCWAWGEPTPLVSPRLPWELIQIGNCGSPLETAEGWLVLTHGVGPMRTYAIGAMLLDLEDPRRVLASLPVPLIAPAGDERDGYVPNVVYSCGALIHGDVLVVPYGFGDQHIAVAVADLPALLASLRRPDAAAKRIT